jgi:toxin CcdB
MAQYDVHLGRDGELLLDIQSDALSGLNTRIVVPIMPSQSAPKPLSHLNPEIVLDDVPYRIVTQFMTAVRLADLGKTLGSLKPLDQRVSRALDFLLHGI